MFGRYPALIVPLAGNSEMLGDFLNAFKSRELP
jgi:hypothetical protein